MQAFPIKIMVTLPLLFLAFIFPSSESRLIARPQPLTSFKIYESQNTGICSFSVSVRTSCSSTQYTKDRISLAFADAYGNQVYAPRLDDPQSRTFERCSSDTFQITGPCTYQICYLYLYISGQDGWMPYDITVQGYNSNPVTFYYNVVIPADTWYGFNHCSGTRAASLAMKSERVQIWSLRRILEWRPSNWTIRGHPAGSLLISPTSYSVHYDQKPANKESSGIPIGFVILVMGLGFVALLIIGYYCLKWLHGRNSSA